MTVIGGVRVGKPHGVRIMGILNTSPESFYQESVRTGNSAIRNAAKQMEDDGADFIDVGGMSTAPYLQTMVSKEVETNRVLNAVGIIQDASNLPISVDTCRASVAEAAMKCGVRIINDISGLKYDPTMRNVASRYGASVILCAYSPRPVQGKHEAVASRLLQESLDIANTASIPANKIVLDPSIGFFRRNGNGPFHTRIRGSWVSRDLAVIRNLSLISPDIPIMVSVSNKSFLGNLLGEDDPLRRLAGSIAAETASVLYGASIIRTHNVRTSRDAATVAAALMHTRHGDPDGC